MATTKLLLYNEALSLHLGERKLASLAEAREPRRALDDIWDGGAIDKCLEKAQWSFATRVTMLNYSSTVTPTFGYARAFEKPSDYIRLAAFCSDELFVNTIKYYEEEAGFWFCDLDEIYVKYVSNDTSYGNDMSLWSPAFASYVAAYLASKVCKRVTQGRVEVAEVEKEAKKLLQEAKSLDAMNRPARVQPNGNWVHARQEYRTDDRGSRGSLIG